MITIKETDDDMRIRASGFDAGFLSLSNKSQRDLLAWFWKERPELVKEVICKNCSESDFSNFYGVEAERK